MYIKTWPLIKERLKLNVEIVKHCSYSTAVNLRIDVETMKPAEHNTQAFRTPASTVKAKGSQNGGHQKASVLPVLSGYTQPENEVSQPSVEEVLCVIADKYVKATPLSSKDDWDSFLAYMKEMKHTMTSVRIGSLGLSAGTGEHCILGNLGLVFIWSCFVSCLLFLLFYVSLHNLRFSTHRRNRKFADSSEL